MSDLLDSADYFVVVKNRAGRQSPVAQSQGYFDLRGTAITDGRAALDVLLKKKPKI